MPVACFDHDAVYENVASISHRIVMFLQQENAEGCEINPLRVSGNKAVPLRFTT